MVRQTRRRRYFLLDRRGAIDTASFALCQVSQVVVEEVLVLVRALLLAVDGRDLL